MIIVHFGDADITTRAIKSFEPGETLPDKIFVIDHGENPFQMATTLPIQFIRPNQNDGYGAGVNVGLGALYSSDIKADDVVVVMNNDVVVHKDTLSELEGWMSVQDKDDVLVGVTVEESGYSVMGGGLLNFWTGRANLLKNSVGVIPAPAGIQYVHGAFLAAPYKLFLATQGWPEKYFMYWEDVLLSKRALKAGYVLSYAPKVKVTHAGNDGASSQKTYYLVRNGASFMEQETSWSIRLYWVVFNHLRRLYHSFYGQSHQDIRQGLRDAAHRVIGPRP